MRKDTIEARIVGIEREMKELRSEIRQELREMISELKEFQGLMIDDRIGEMQDAMDRQYCQVAYDAALSRARETFQDQIHHDCPPGWNRDECIDHMVENHLRADIAEIENALPDQVGKTVESILDRDAAEAAQDAGTACEGCLLIYDAERDRLLAMAEKFIRYRQGLSRTRERVSFRQLPDDMVVSEIVGPLSHRARFAMLKCMTSRSASFKELEEVTGYDGGHLVYHLNKLISAGLTCKDEATGLYQITEKGANVMEIVKKMYEQ
ncbi:MAG TPA: hypothetical protein VK436_14305 [Methanocella sp.]|nr:hypothetical protein [Methanocella sp.]